MYAWLSLHRKEEKMKPKKKASILIRKQKKQKKVKLLNIYILSIIQSKAQY